MTNAFKEVFSQGYKKVIIIGSDCFSLSSQYINDAFANLENHDFVIGPSEDGGYYLLGMKDMSVDLFSNMEWSVTEVFKKTMNRMSSKTVFFLPCLNDIDTEEDLSKEPELYYRVINGI